YLEYLLDRHRYLNFKGMGVSDRVALKLPLLDLYVPLKARQELPEGDTWKRVHLAGRELADAEGAAMRMSEPQPVLEILQKQSGLVILGDPGSGKTTFLKYLALVLATGKGESLGLGQRLPILVPLSAYANALANGHNIRLDDFIADYFHEIGTNLPIAAMLAEALKAGAALILLDGLDEVKNLGLRHTVVERVSDFYSFHRRAGNKFVLTSRVIGYRDVRPTADGLNECTLVDFDDAEIAAFVERWMTAIETQAQGDTRVAQKDAELERKELLEAIQHNPGVRRLACNPLLLTILALMKRQGVTLPERRVELYDQYVRTLLSTWNRARGLSGRAPGRDPDVVQTLRILAPLALWMHQVSAGVGLVKREDLRRKLEELYQQRGDPQPEAAARQFLADVREHAALLLERGPGEYGFIHLTFEEYLAAVAIALSGQGDSRPIVDQLAPRVGEQPWREVSLLTVSYLGIIQQLDTVAGEVVETLAEEQPGEAGAAVVLAGEAVLDSWPGGVPPKSKTRVERALVAAMQSAEPDPQLRRRAGLLLGRLGWQPDDPSAGSGRGLDEFMPVPAGKFLYGGKKEERHIPYDYWIAKYPVTNLQYARFMDAGGYQNPEYWSKEGWKMRQEKDWEQPRYWQNADWNNPIFPVVSVSWYEAEAYCNWLATQALGIAIPDGYTVRLPTEEEWERAARGTDGREYPWGDEFTRFNLNSAEFWGGKDDLDWNKWYEAKGYELASTTAVGQFLGGKSPTGAMDMSGNVFEWTISEESNARVVRGGSWLDPDRDARCAFRLRHFPVNRLNYFGFRVILSLANSPTGMLRDES
ncbi:MAG: SUMF1/EgtB/PvdO family nonheme iron enzyme, partial [Anaerolineae bacterium]|nr:SUMF1/EgtB/PvdO family nonheme iron enzyme [Anaerolineae bacterium]